MTNPCVPSNTHWVVWGLTTVVQQPWTGEEGMANTRPVRRASHVMENNNRGKRELRLTGFNSIVSLTWQL